MTGAGALFQACRFKASVLALLALAARPARCACTPQFPYQQGWLGGDGAYSIPLSSNRSVWLFGDTFVGNTPWSTRADSQLVGNSIAVSSCQGGRWGINYFWNGSPQSPSPFFGPPANADKFWPLDGFTYGGKLYVALSRVQGTTAGGPFGFQLTGVTLARVDNPWDNPAAWSISYRNLSDGTMAFPGVSAVVLDNYVYLYTALANPAQKGYPSMALARVAVKDLDSPQSSLEVLDKNRAWKRGIGWQDAAVVMENGGSELSVRPHLNPGGNSWTWVAVQQKPQFGSGDVVARTASNLGGPWSDFRTLYSIPEAKTKNTFCYAAKEHAEFQDPSGKMMFTYVCNSFDPNQLISNMNIYRPQPVFLRDSSLLPQDSGLGYASQFSLQDSTGAEKPESSAYRADAHDSSGFRDR